jgi:hypothetical protein
MSQTKTKPAAKKVRCEGWRRYGGAFTLGPVTWEQCKETATVMLTCKQFLEPTKTLPACHHCWREASATTGIQILKVEPI